jgi:ribosomal protein L24
MKSGNIVKVICGKYRNIIDKIEKIDRKRNIVYLEKINHQKFIKKTKTENENKTKKVFIPIHISNVVIWKEK